jgi:hypothetical protein
LQNIFEFLFLQKQKLKQITMKKILLAVLLIAPFLGMSQTTKPIDGFSGIKFGSNSVTVLAALKAKGGIINKENTEKDYLALDHVKIGTRVASVMVKFINDKAFEADYLFLPEVEGKLLELYKGVDNDITLAYGSTKQVSNKYKDPYKEGEEESLTLIGLSAGNIDFTTSWFDSAENSIQITITTDMIVKLTYQDNKLTDQAVAKQNEKKKSDF